MLDSANAMGPAPRMIAFLVAAAAYSCGSDGGNNPDAGSIGPVSDPWPDCVPAQGTAAPFARAFGGAGSDGRFALGVNAAGNAAVVAGSFDGTVDFGRGPLTSAGMRDIVVARIDGNGNTLWSRRFGSTEVDQPGAVAVGAAGATFVTRLFQRTVDFGGGPLMENGQGDLFLLKLDPASNHWWSKRFGSYYTDAGNGLAVSPTGDIVLIGGFDGEINFGGATLTAFANAGFLAKFDTDGHHLWSRQLGDALGSGPMSVAVDSNGDVVVTGFYMDTPNIGGGPLPRFGYYDAFVAKYSSQGEHVWSKGFGSNRWEGGLGIAVDHDDSIVIVGANQGAIDFGGGPLTSNCPASRDDCKDIFVAKLAPDGSHVWSRRIANSINDQLNAAVTVDDVGRIHITGSFAGRATCRARAAARAALDCAPIRDRASSSRSPTHPRAAPATVRALTSRSDTLAPPIERACRGAFPVRSAAPVSASRYIDHRLPCNCRASFRSPRPPGSPGPAGPLSAD